MNLSLHSSVKSFYMCTEATLNREPERGTVPPLNRQRESSYIFIVAQSQIFSMGTATRSNHTKTQRNIKRNIKYWNEPTKKYTKLQVAFGPE